MVQINRDACTIQIVGVGGQGALTVSKIIGAAAVKKGTPIIISEIHGMAQRGGVVQTTIRLGEVISPLPFGQDVTVMVGFEPLEVYRARSQLTMDTIVVMSTDPVRPVSVSSGGQRYPEPGAVVEEMKKRLKCVFPLSAKASARTAGNERVTNVVMLGALTGTDVLPFSYEEMRSAVGKIVPSRSLEVNLKAFDIGYNETHGKKA
ncbi:MAG: indolepyruvate oxidoreductase subunit beta [Candidatus Thermoplasmatota archaeon]|nr:indolepyruvate oxidoreductase subunit beta [Candidatus Thermoplasmatota archaeon]